MGQDAVATTPWGATPRPDGRFAACRRHIADRFLYGRLQLRPHNMSGCPRTAVGLRCGPLQVLSLIHISEPTRLDVI
eukprot:398674-Prorocentrum_lima.AAC.1